MPHKSAPNVTRRSICFAFINICVMAYFGYHVIIGDHGLLSRWRLADEVSQLQADVQELKSRRAKLKNKVSLVRPESLDPDMLDERARGILNLAHPNDITILRPARLTSD